MHISKEVAELSEMEKAILALSNLPIDEALEVIKGYEEQGWIIEYLIFECTGRKELAVCSIYNKIQEAEQNPVHG